MPIYSWQNKKKKISNRDIINNALKVQFTWWKYSANFLKIGINCMYGCPVSWCNVDSSMTTLCVIHLMLLVIITNSDVKLCW